MIVWKMMMSMNKKYIPNLCHIIIKSKKICLESFSRLHGRGYSQAHGLQVTPLKKNNQLSPK